MNRLEALSRGTLTRANSRVIATRVPLKTAERIIQAAAAHGVAPHVFLRQAVTRLTATPLGPDPEGILADLTKALGLPPLSSPDAVLSALKDLFAALQTTTDPLAAGAQPPPDQLSMLSATERAVASRMPDPVRRQAYVSERARLHTYRESLTYSPANLAAAKQAGITPEEFAERKKKLTRRA